MKTTAAFLFAGTASATLGWLDAPTYKTPSNNDNQCTSQEQSGFDWMNLAPGSFSSYDSYSFSGFECASSLGKRDTLTKRTFGDKVIQGSMGAGSGPSFSCGSDKDFSISEYQVSVSNDTDVEFHYQMEDGSTCKQTTPCKSGGTIVQNSQCGGAKQVQFQLPQGSEGDCDIGIHSIGFDCSPPASSVPPPKATSSSTPASRSSSSFASPSSSPAIPTLPSSYSSPAVSSTPVSPVTSSSSIPIAIPIPSGDSYCENGNGTSIGPDCVVFPSLPTSSISVPISISISSRPISCEDGNYEACPEPSSFVAAVPSSSSSSSSSLPVPVPNVPASSSTPVSPVTTSSSSSMGVPALPSSSEILKPSSANPSVPATTAPCPDVVPQCLNTWIGQTGCKDNSDHQCYCQKADFTKNVIECISAHGADDSEVQKALTYLIGICAAHVPQNPGLITNCPSSIPLTAAAAPPSSTPSTTPVSPVLSTPVPIASTVTEVVVTSYSSCSIGQTIVAAGTTSVLQAPSISTITMTSTSVIPCSECAAATTPFAAAVTPVSPVTQSAPAVPMTTVTIAQSYTVPFTYATGPSAGFPVPSSFTVTMLSTAVTVPQVAFTTLPATSGATAAAVGLAPATVVPVVPGYSASAEYSSSAPAAVATAAAATNGISASAEYSSSAPAAVATAAAATNSIYTAPGVASYTGFGTTYVPTSTKTGGPLQVTTNAGSKVGGSVAGLFAGAAVAVLAL